MATSCFFLPAIYYTAFSEKKQRLFRCKVYVLSEKVYVLNARAVKRGNERIACGFLILNKAVLNAGFEKMVFNAFVFIISDFAVEVGEFGCPPVRNVLPHKTEHNLARFKRFRDPVDYAERVFHMARQKQMPDDDSALHESGLFINSVRSRLTEHFADSAFRSFEVVLCARKTFSKSIVAVFDIREINLEFAFESLQIFNGFVPICIADHGDGEGGVQRFQNRIGEMHRRHQIDVVCAFRNEFTVNFPQPFHRDFLPLAFTADFVVLAVDAAQIASGKEDGSGNPPLSCWDLLYIP